MREELEVVVGEIDQGRPGAGQSRLGYSQNHRSQGK